ncbi:MAG: acyl-[acyl-carrier-protein]--UDP-N-acetylglucosamine O-acyltransferase [Acidobacteria bacterium]|nr:MAG: acyl-[acyl-carrier-protein]--UDP-N-acetylglucosamine O-acyltransferase [Acidobacteriota bacterium]
MSTIHPTAIIHERVQIADQVEIGPYCIIEPDVKIDSGTKLMAHVYVGRYTKIGRNNTLFPFSVVGVIPQDLKFAGGETHLVIGDHNMIREHCSIHRGTENAGGITKIGNRNLIMGHAHIAHDCLIGDDNIFSQGATLAGHVEVMNRVILGGYSGVHQFCRLGNYAFVGGYSVVTQDALPFIKAVGNRAKNYGVNNIGLERQGFSKEDIRNIQKAYRILFKKKLRLSEALQQLKEQYSHSERVLELVAFIESSERGFLH